MYSINGFYFNDKRKLLLIENFVIKEYNYIFLICYNLLVLKKNIKLLM